MCRLWCLFSWWMCQRFASEENSERFWCDHFCRPSEGLAALISIEWADDGGKKINLGSTNFFLIFEHVWIGKKAISSCANCWEKISYMYGSDWRFHCGGMLLQQMLTDTNRFIWAITDWIKSFYSFISILLKFVSIFFKVSSFKVAAVQDAECGEKISLPPIPSGCSGKDFIRWRDSVRRDFTVNRFISFLMSKFSGRNSHL